MKKGNSDQCSNKSIEYIPVKINLINFGNTSKTISSTNTYDKLSFYHDNSSKLMTLSNLYDLMNIELDNSSIYMNDDEDQNIEKNLTKLYGKYTKDLNILRIHRLVVDQIIHSEKINIKEAKQSLTRELINIKQAQNIVNRKSSLDKIKIYKEICEKSSNDNKLSSYINDTKDILQKYKKIGPLPTIISYKKEQTPKKNDEHKEYRYLLIEQYLEIVKKYLKINIVKDYQVNNVCIECNYELGEIVSDEYGTVYCPNCDVEFITLVGPYNNENNEDKQKNQNNYENRENFWKALIRYQGKQNIHLPDELKHLLDDYFTSLGLMIGEIVKLLPLNDDLTRGNTNLILLYEALHDIGYNSYYEHANLIGYVYWGWKLPDVSHLEDKVMRDYDKTQEIFKHTKGDRKSCLNVQYRLWRHLSRCGHPCKPSDFKIVKTPGIIRYHETQWAIFCEELGWKKPKPIF